MYLSNHLNVNYNTPTSYTTYNQTIPQTSPFLMNEINNNIPIINSKQNMNSTSSFFPINIPFTSVVPNINSLQQQQQHDHNEFPDDLFPTRGGADINVFEEEDQAAAAAAVGVMMDSKYCKNPKIRKWYSSSAASSKKDRHSKINTVHGPRDRRMRLSLEVARMFFDLQDMLGFDRASKTVEWLMMKSKIAIKELDHNGRLLLEMNKNNTNSSIITNGTGSCDIASESCDHHQLLLSSSSSSSIIINNNNNKNQKVIMRKMLMNKEEKIKKIKKKKEVSTSTSTGVPKRPFCPLARESREKARARARERTSEKRRVCLEAVNKLLGFCNNNTFEAESSSSAGAPQAQSGLINHSFQVPITSFDHQEHVIGSTPTREDEDIVGHVADHTLVINGNWSPSSVMFNYMHNSGTYQDHDQHQSTEFQCYGKPWEAYNNVNLL